MELCVRLDLLTDQSTSQLVRLRCDAPQASALLLWGLGQMQAAAARERAVLLALELPVGGARRHWRSTRSLLGGDGSIGGGRATRALSMIRSPKSGGTGSRRGVRNRSNTAMQRTIPQPG